MNDTKLDQRIERVIDVKIKAIDRWIDENIDELEKFGNPEKLIGKPYEMWTNEDKMILGQIYGTGPDSILEKFLANKEISKMYESEKGL
jgi:hypothetical protein